MECLASMTVEDICRWLTDHQIATSVVESFRENEIDGDAMITMMSTVTGPDCLKEVVPRIGIRMKVYKLLKLISDADDCEVVEKPAGGNDESRAIHDTRGNDTSLMSSKKRKLSVSSCASSPTSSLADKEDLSMSSPSQEYATEKPTKLLKRSIQNIPDPFPVPVFRKATEANLKNHLLTNSDRKYMVQTLTTLLLTYVERPTMNDCLKVSKAVHMKFKFLGDDGSSENSWKWFIYTRAQNINRKPIESDSEPSRIASPAENKKRKHSYPTIPHDADDDKSHSRNLELLKAHLLLPPAEQSTDTLKQLMTRTFAKRRHEIINSDLSVSSILKDFPLLEKSAYAKLEFELIIQRPELKEEFDEDFIGWARSAMIYAKKSCMKTAVVKKIIEGTDFKISCDDNFLINALRCLGVLLTTRKSKKADGDIPFLVRFVPNHTPPADIPDPENNQPHITVVEHEDYNQYYVAVEKKLLTESTNMATAVFFLLAIHYIFNLSYHSKVADVLRFIQEKVAGIPSDDKVSTKSPVASSHINGISLVHDARSQEELDTTSVSDDD